MTVKRWVEFAVALVAWLTANEGQGGILVQFANVPEHAKPLQLLGSWRVPTLDGPGPYPVHSFWDGHLTSHRSFLIDFGTKERPVGLQHGVRLLRLTCRVVERRVPPQMTQRGHGRFGTPKQHGLRRGRVRWKFTSAL